MALARCAECGHRVSQHAKQCPSCGVEFEDGVFGPTPEQIKKEEESNVRFAKWIGVILALFVFAMIFADDDGKPTAEQEREYRKHIREAPERQKERESKRFWDSLNR